MEYIDKKDTHLKFHRFMQIIGLPLLIIANSFTIVTCVGSIFNIKLPWPYTVLKEVQQFMTTLSKGAMTPLLTSVCIIVLALIFLVLDVYAWVGSFKWRKYSYRSLMIALFLTMLIPIGIAAFVELSIIRGNNLSIIYGQSITSPTLKDTLIFGLRLDLVLMLLVDLFAVGSFFTYYFKRRKLYNNDDYIEDEPDAPVYGQPQVTSPITPLPDASPKPQPQPYAPEPVSEPEPVKPFENIDIKPQPVTEEPKPVMEEPQLQEAQETIVLEMPEPSVPDNNDTTENN